MKKIAARCDRGVTEELVKQIAARKPLRAVEFSNHSAKINIEQIFNLVSPGTEVKAI
jgi:adenine-specific DNA-methyltransferase